MSIQKKFRRLLGHRRTTKEPLFHDVGDFTIALTPDHALPRYQAAHPKYDRFLPHLCAALTAGDVVVDVGANVGDTAAAIITANPDLRVVAIEADQVFFEILQANVERIRSRRATASIITGQFLVANDVSDVTLVGSAGTKSAVPGGNVKGVPLTEILRQNNVTSVRLIKSDVDGYDFDVINSAVDLLDQGPMLYFECQYDNVAQYDGYLDTLRMLETDKGYQNFDVFDNFGQHISQFRSVDEMRGLLGYVARQNFSEKSSRTIHYYDILVTRDKDQSLVRSAIEDYNAW